MILKIIGILILTILLLLVLVLCLLLFVPVRYQARAEIDGGLKAEGSVTWFLRVLNVTGRYESGGLHLSVRILGKELLHRPAEEEQTPEPDEDEDGIPYETEDVDREILDRIPDTDEENREETLIMNGEDRAGMSGMVGNSQDEISETDGKIGDGMTDTDGKCRNKISDIDGKIQDGMSGMEGEHSDEEYTNGEHQGTPFGQIRNIFRHIRGIFYSIGNSFQSIRKKFRQIRNSFQNLREKIGRLKERADRWIRLWNAEQTGQARLHLWKNIRYLCRHYLPRKLEGRIRFGLEDPAATGQALGMLYILSACTGNRLEVEGEFQDPVLEGAFRLKGHIRACHFLIAALGLLADKNIRLTFRRVQRLRQGCLS